jgi:hypothetical protein
MPAQFTHVPPFRHKLYSITQTHRNTHIQPKGNSKDVLPPPAIRPDLTIPASAYPAHVTHIHTILYFRSYDPMKLSTYVICATKISCASGAAVPVRKRDIHTSRPVFAEAANTKPESHVVRPLGVTPVPPDKFGVTSSQRTKGSENEQRDTP